MIRKILLLGNPELYNISEPVKEKELGRIKEVVDDLHDTMADFRKQYGVGRAIASPQIGVLKRLIYMYIDTPVVFINPVLRDKSNETMVVWDDCMSFPDLLVKVKRYQSCRIVYRDMEWKKKEMTLKGDLSEILQHEYDHLDGILAVSKAIDNQSFALKSQKGLSK